jgi:hypothetical protein
MNILLRLVFVISTGCTLIGCAAPASQSAMIASLRDVSVKRSEKLVDAVFVRSVTGGKSTNPMWTSQVDNETFKSALNESLAVVGYKASDSSKARYLIDVELRKLDQPLIGIDFEVTSEVSYSVDSESGKHVYPISADGKAVFSDSLLGVERLKLANEKSIKANITRFINMLTSKYQ